MTLSNCIFYHIWQNSILFVLINPHLTKCTLSPNKVPGLRPKCYAAPVYGRRYSSGWFGLMATVELLVTEGSFLATITHSVAACGNCWQLLRSFCTFWHLWEQFGNFWHLLATFWKLLETVGNVWKLLATFGNFLVLWGQWEWAPTHSKLNVFRFFVFFSRTFP